MVGRFVGQGGEHGVPEKPDTTLCSSLHGLCPAGRSGVLALPVGRHARGCQSNYGEAEAHLDRDRREIGVGLSFFN